MPTSWAGLTSGRTRRIRRTSARCALRLVGHHRVHDRHRPSHWRCAPRLLRRNISDCRRDRQGSKRRPIARLQPAVVVAGDADDLDAEHGAVRGARAARDAAAERDRAVAVAGQDDADPRAELGRPFADAQRDAGEREVERLGAQHRVGTDLGPQHGGRDEIDALRPPLGGHAQGIADAGGDDLRSALAGSAPSTISVANQALSPSWRRIVASPPGTRSPAIARRSRSTPSMRSTVASTRDRRRERATARRLHRARRRTPPAPRSRPRSRGWHRLTRPGSLSRLNPARGCSSMVERRPSKPQTRVRFPPPASSGLQGGSGGKKAARSELPSYVPLKNQLKSVDTSRQTTRASEPSARQETAITYPRLPRLATLVASLIVIAIPAAALQMLAS